MQLNTSIPSVPIPYTNVWSLMAAWKCNVLVMERGAGEEEREGGG